MRTDLQRLLSKRGESARLARVLSKSRATISRWKLGQAYPDRLMAQRLIDVYRAEGLDHNGIYQPTPDA